MLRDAVQRGLDHIAATGATVTWTLANHDVHRAVTRYGQDQATIQPSRDDPAAGTRLRAPVDVAQGTRYARAAALVLLGLPGSVYVFQGEELGLPEVMDLPDAQRQDPVYWRSGGKEKGRDGSRVPLPWQADQPSFGFSMQGAAPGDGPHPPWLPQPPWFAGYAVDAEEADPGSMLALYRSALALRPELFGRHAPLAWVEVAGRPDVLAYSRGPVTVVAVCGPDPLDLSPEWGRPVLASAPLDGPRLPGGAGAWLRRDAD
jgi:alpha-glucosidase